MGHADRSPWSSCTSRRNSLPQRLEFSSAVTAGSKPWASTPTFRDASPSVPDSCLSKDSLHQMDSHGSAGSLAPDAAMRVCWHPSVDRKESAPATGE